MRGPRRIDVIGVVVPARDEQDHLPGCLLALSAAARAVRALPAAPRVRILVVQDGCTDGTAGVVAAWPQVETVQVSTGRVGAARARGVARILESEAAAGVPADRVWIACTDADSLVPATWLHTQLAHARTGVDLLLGMVRLHGEELSPAARRAWTARHPARDGHPHVHGANLGVRGSVYTAVGGFPDVAEHEDVLLSAAVRDGGGRVVSVAASPVRTSARLTGRLPGGLSGYLREMVTVVEPPELATS